MALWRVGMATMYVIAGPLFCNCELGSQIVAMPVEQVRSGAFHCGEWVMLCYSTRNCRVYQVGDVGPLTPYSVKMGDDYVPIVADVPAPAPFRGLSAPVKVYKLKMQLERQEERDGFLTG